MLEERQPTVHGSAATGHAGHATLDKFVVIVAAQAATLLSSLPELTCCAPTVNTDARPIPPPGTSTTSEPAIIPMRSAGTNAFRQIVRDAAACIPTSARPSTTHGNCVAWLVEVEPLERSADMAINTGVGDEPSIRMDATRTVACDQHGQSLMKGVRWMAAVLA